MAYKLYPSRADQWVACPASVRLQKDHGIDDGKRSSAEEGIAAHWLVQQTINEGTQCPSLWLNKSADNGVIINSEMVSAVKLYLENLFEIVDFYLKNTVEIIDNLKAILKIEQKLEVKDFLNGITGICDAYLYDDKTNVLYVWDFKYGRRPVEVANNWQLRIYALMIIGSIPLSTKKIMGLKIHLRIVQPRCYHSDGTVREHVFGGHEVYSYFKLLHDQGVMAAQQENPPATVGSHCRYCTAKHACSALQQNAYDAIDKINVATPDILDSISLGTELNLLEEAKEMIEHRLIGLQAQAELKLRQGGSVHGFHMEQTRGFWKWNIPVEEIHLLGELYGVNLMKPVATVTPKQAIDLKISEEIVTQRSERLPGKLKLAKDGKNIADIFK